MQGSTLRLAQQCGNAQGRGGAQAGPHGAACEAQQAQAEQADPDRQGQTRRGEGSALAHGDDRAQLAEAELDSSLLRLPARVDELVVAQRSRGSSAPARNSRGRRE